MSPNAKRLLKKIALALILLWGLFNMFASIGKR